MDPRGGPRSELATWQPAPGASPCCDAERRASELEKELFSLRESTKKALQQTWDEADALQSSSAESEAKARGMEIELSECRRREEDWREKFETSQRTLLETTRGSWMSLTSLSERSERSGESQQQPQRDGGGGNGNSFFPILRNLSHRMLNGGGRGESSLTSCQSDTIRSILDRSTFLTDEERHDLEASVAGHISPGEGAGWGKVGNERDGADPPGGAAAADKSEGRLIEDLRDRIETMQMELSNRDTMITSMESTVGLQVKTLSELRTELDAARIDFGETESALSEQVRDLTDRLKEKKRILVELQDRMTEAQGYILELTTELEHVYKLQEEEDEAGKVGSRRRSIL